MEPDDYDEDGPGIDFKFDGDSYLGPLAPKHKRRILDVLRQLVQSTVSGADSLELAEKLQELYTDLDKSIKNSQGEARRHPDQADFHAANIDAYNAVMDAIEHMDESLAGGDFVTLQEGFEELTEALGQINHGAERRVR